MTAYWFDDDTDGRDRLLGKVFSSTSQSTSVEFRFGLCSGQSVSECVMLPEPLFHTLSSMDPGVVILEHAHAAWEEKIHWYKTLLSFHYICVVNWPLFWTDNTAEPGQLKQLQITTMACTVDTRHDWCLTSSTSTYPDAAITLVYSKFTHQTTWPFSIESSLKATQLFSPNLLSTLRILHVEMILHSLLHIAISALQSQ